MAKALVLYTGNSPTLGKKETALRDDGVWFSRNYVSKGRFGWGWTKWAKCEEPSQGTWTTVHHYQPELPDEKHVSERITYNGIELWEKIDFGFKTMHIVEHGEKMIRLPND